MRFDLIRACENCPFRKDGEGVNPIRFASRERAREIEETAYRQGFPCHRHAVQFEDEDGEEGGFEFNTEGTSQHCFGALAMYMSNGGSGNVPFEWALDEDPDLETRWWDRTTLAEVHACFDDEEAFLVGAVDKPRGTK